MSQQKLIQAAYKVIAEEGLPEPKYIRYRYPKQGAKRSDGTCHKKRDSSEYWIILPLTTMKYIEDENGVYTDKITKKKFSGTLVHHTMKKLIKNMGHEIAHLKFWNHNAQHKSYTAHIISKLNIHLNSDGG